jgi:hypothetical protein
MRLASSHLDGGRFQQLVFLVHYHQQERQRGVAWQGTTAVGVRLSRGIVTAAQGGDPEWVGPAVHKAAEAVQVPVDRAVPAEEMRGRVVGLALAVTLRPRISEISTIGERPDTPSWHSESVKPQAALQEFFTDYRRRPMRSRDSLELRVFPRRKPRRTSIPFRQLCNVTIALRRKVHNDRKLNPAIERRLTAMVVWLGQRGGCLSDRQNWRVTCSPRLTGHLSMRVFVALHQRIASAKSSLRWTWANAPNTYTPSRGWTNGSAIGRRCHLQTAQRQVRLAAHGQQRRHSRRLPSSHGVTSSASEARLPSDARLRWLAEWPVVPEGAAMPAEGSNCLGCQVVGGHEFPLSAQQLEWNLPTWCAA